MLEKFPLNSLLSKAKCNTHYNYAVLKTKAYFKTSFFSAFFRPILIKGKKEFNGNP
jgi:hypothetical protein